jgi:hypothetical protein
MYQIDEILIRISIAVRIFVLDKKIYIIFKIKKMGKI